MKKIMFLNTTKLASISVGLLLVIFCTIGMSFTPGDDGDIVQPNDTTALAGRPGPRKSHWTESGCSTTYKNAIDYGKVVVTVVDGTGGAVSVTGTGNAQNITGNSSTAVTITWNCGYSGDGQKNDLTDKHTNNITFTASRLTGYNFLGWYEDAGCTVLKSPELSYTETFTIAHDSYSSRNTEYESSSTPQTWNRYAKFVEIVPADLTFIAPVGGSYTVTVGGVETAVTSDIVKTGITTEVSLSATPASGYIFAGWYMLEDGGNVSDLSANANYTKTFASDATIGARFVSTSLPKFLIKETSTQYYGLKAACAAAAIGQTIVPVADATLNGEDLLVADNGVYTIPSGVTLLIPYDAANTVEKDQPTSVDPAAASNCKPYRTLTLAEGITLSVSGAISVATKQYATNTTYTQTGVRTYYGFIYMNANSKIVLNSGATLYAWGYISGDGEVIANSGSTVYEMFQFQDFRGGTRTYNMKRNSQKVFPFQQYYIQNIESKLTLEYGATEYVRFIIYMSETQFPNTVKLVGTEGAMFTMSGGSGRVTKQYERATDRMHYTFSGTASLSSISMSFSYSIFSVTVNSKDYVLPINNNMTIDILSGTTFNMTQDISVLPGAEINIESGAKVVVPSDKALYVYDQAEWKGKGCCYNSADIKQLAFVGKNHNNEYGAPKTRSITSSAKIKVDGTLEISGALYTTTTGADICSTSAGVVSLKAAAGTATETYQDKGNSDYQEIPITAAKLHNSSTWYSAPYSGDCKACEYLATAGAAANTTIKYANGHWGWVEIWKDYDGTVLKAVNTVAKSTNGSSPSDPTREDYSFSGWGTADVDDTNQEVTHIATYTPLATQYTITVASNGNGTVSGGGTFDEYSTTQISATANTGYHFEKWQDNNTDNPRTITVTENAAYTATFAANTYSVRFNGNGATSGSMNNQSFTYDEAPKALTVNAFAKDGYSFDGWATSANGNVVYSDGQKVNNLSSEQNAVVDLYAKWTVKSYTISFDSNGGSEVASITQNYGTVVTPPANPTRTGYTFDHWELAVPTTMPASNTECVAQWTANTYFVHFNGNDATSGSMNNQSFTYDEAPKALTVNAFAKDGYSFDGWATSANGNVVYSDGQNVNNLSSEQNAVVDLYAKWRLYTITWRNMDGSLFETPNNPTSIEYDAKPAPPIENPTYSDNTHQLYVFTKWKAASDGHEYTTADLPNVTADETYTAQYDIVSELVVEGEQSISTETVVSTALLKVSGKLTVGATLTTDDLILEATPSSSGELVGESNVVATNAYFEFSQPGGFKARTWYAVAVPWQVEADGGISAKKGDGDFAPLQLGSGIDLIYYKGDIRAASGPINECWQYVEDDPSNLQIMQQGRAYMFCLYTPADIVRFARKSDPGKTTPSVKTYDSTTGKPNDANWNGIANPATYHAYINAYADKYQGTENAGQVYDADNKSYKVINLSTTQLLVGQPVFVQATTDSEIQVSANKPTSAPRRAKAQSTRLTRYEIQLVANDSEKADRIIVRMDEDKEKDEYVVGKDLIKMGLSSLVPQIYINRYGSAMCINTAKPIHDKAEYPLGIFAPEAGEYDIFVAEASNEDVNIYLTYNGKAIWNLAYGPYTIALDKGTTNSYGLRLSAPAPQVTTGIEEAVVDAQGETRKVLINNHVFIIRGNNVYGIDGQLIK